MRSVKSNRSFVKQIHSGSRKLNETWFISIAGDRNVPDVRGQRIAAEPFSPLDNHHRIFVGEKFIQLDRMGTGSSLVKPIQVDVIKQKPAGVRIDQGK